jgi:hypothetical protein
VYEVALAGVENVAMTADQKPTLSVFSEGVPIFTSHGHWLYPLFELEAYLAEQSVEPARLLLEDTIIGKAAAALIHRLGFRTVKTGILSRLGEAVFQRHQIVYTYAQLVQRIHCQTEAQLASVDDPEEIYRLIQARRNASRF